MSFSGFYIYIIFQITKIAISPTAENPLVRKPLRSDIYSKAAELRILNVPGARVEDRQYEIVCGNISMSSGKWDQIREQLEPSEKVSRFVDLTLYYLNVFIGNIK